MIGHWSSVFASTAIRYRGREAAEESEMKVSGGITEENGVNSVRSGGTVQYSTLLWCTHCEAIAGRHPITLGELCKDS